jgi:hypothetical protein
VPLRRSVPLPRGLPPKRIVPVRKMRLQPRRGPDRSPGYLAWIRTLGCVVCARFNGSVDRCRSGAHERSGFQRDRAEDVRLLGDSALCSPSPGESGFLSSFGRERILAQTWGLTCKRSCFDCRVDSGSKNRPQPALFIRWRCGDRRKGPRQFPRAAACSRLLRTLRADFVALRTWFPRRWGCRHDHTG